MKVLGGCKDFGYEQESLSEMGVEGICPPKIEVFVWQQTKGRVMVRDLMQRFNSRNLMSNVCPLCNIDGEYVDHIFLHLWTVWEAKKKVVFRGKAVDFSLAVDTVKFRVGWWIKHYGKGSIEPVTTILLNLKDRCTESIRAKLHRLETWIPQSLDVLKFNVDCSARGSPGQVGMREVLRNSSGRVLCFFSKYSGILDANMAKISVIHRASKICASNPNLIGREIVIVSDSKSAVSWVNEGRFGSIKHVNLIFNIRCNLNKLGNMVVIFNSRASNSFVDMLSKKGFNMEGDIFI
ncbi:hypothetical protein Dsin_005847 [Dipteronia sinensis]|uniref:RNase H type-1 domain-containing protein n=1 Tax=Dipteronia sinensis TaxID=43782 RepID=A0AAE0EGW1_9ROSI|nr:hypothetical protein Dsin_005847 [Dipteronia sinensis]